MSRITEELERNIRRLAEQSDRLYGDALRYQLAGNEEAARQTFKHQAEVDKTRARLERQLTEEYAK